jgi:transposase
MEGKKLMLHHDNASAHASLLIHEFLAKNETTIMPQPPYSPDLAPADFFLFPTLKSTLKGR